MSAKNLIVITGAGGFIAGNLALALNRAGHSGLILVDDFRDHTKRENIKELTYEAIVERSVFPEWLLENAGSCALVFHLGARTDTTEFNFRVLDALNLSYSKSVWEICTVKEIPLIYASSAATYGLGECGFSDDHENVKRLKPLNPYGLSKQLFDLFVLEQNAAPPNWCGLKFFNVYGPGESHKGRMASVVFHAYRQIKATGSVKLFQSHHPDFADGGQLRDFVYINDVVSVCLFFMQKFLDTSRYPSLSGIYNLGSGKARSFNDLAKALFQALDLPVNISYIPTPDDIRDKYQYFTEADIQKLRSAGYTGTFLSLEEGVKQYAEALRHSF